MKLWLSLFLFTLPTAHAWTEGVIKVPDAFVITPNDLSLDFFKLDTEHVWDWVPNSLEWVRLDKRFDLPRATIRLHTAPTAQVTYYGQTFLPNESGVVTFPVVLTQEQGAAKNEIIVKESAAAPEWRAPIVFRRVRPIDTPLVIDVSCSPFHFKVLSSKLNHSWVNLGCRAIHSAIDSTYGNKVNLDVFWEMEGSPKSLKFNDRQISLDDGLLTQVSVDSNTSVYHFKRGDGDQADEFELEVHVSEFFHSLSVGMGLGLHSYQNAIQPVLNLYTTYYSSETMKVALFGTAPINNSPEINLGLYLIPEQFRGLDEHLSVNLLLGAQGLIFNAFGTSNFDVVAAQGIELTVHDLFARAKNFTAGGFFYPMTSQVYYTDVWFRYGGSVFVEFNFIEWQQPVGNLQFDVKSAGISVGFPLYRAL